MHQAGTTAVESCPTPGSENPQLAWQGVFMQSGCTPARLQPGQPLAGTITHQHQAESVREQMPTFKSTLTMSVAVAPTLLT